VPGPGPPAAPAPDEGLLPGGALGRLTPRADLGAVRLTASGAKVRLRARRGSDPIGGVSKHRFMN
jgi:hypothetical protein